MTNIVKFGAAALAATAILSSNAVAQGGFIGIEGALLQSQVTLDEIYSSIIDDPKDTSVELGLKGGYDFDTFRVWGGLSLRTTGSQKYNLSDGVNFIDGEVNWHTSNFLVGINYTPSLSDNLKLSLGAYTGLSIVKGKFNGQASYASVPYTLSYSKSGVGNLFGAKLGAIYEVVKNNEIEFGVKGDFQTTGIEDYDNIVNYGVYIGYNHKF